MRQGTGALATGQLIRVAWWPPDLTGCQYFRKTAGDHVMGNPSMNETWCRHSVEIGEGLLLRQLWLGSAGLDFLRPSSGTFVPENCDGWSCRRSSWPGSWTGSSPCRATPTKLSAARERHDSAQAARTADGDPGPREGH